MICTCLTKDLFAYGCKCGAIQKEVEKFTSKVEDNLQYQHMVNYNYNHKFVASLKDINSTNCGVCNKTGWIASQFSDEYEMRCTTCSNEKCLRCNNTGIGSAGGFGEDIPCSDCSKKKADTIQSA